jgi:aspartate/methionine/tyrosine aminotransferase
VAGHLRTRHRIQSGCQYRTGLDLNEILSFAKDEERERFLNHKVVYGRPAGSESLRYAIAEMHGVDADAVQVVTGASEALLILMWLAAEPGANVILPRPGFTTFSALPESTPIGGCRAGSKWQ